MDAEPRRVTLANGVTLDYVERGDPQGVPLVLVHAVADSLRAFERVMPLLPPTIRALAPSQRGHGDSDRPETGYRPGDFATDLALFLDALGIRSAVVAGGSSGGVVARRFAMDHPERTMGLAMLGSPHALGEKPGVREMWESTFAPLADPVDPAMVREFVEMTVAPAVPRDFLEVLVAESLKPPALVWRETMRGLIEDDSAGRLERIAAPTLILWGDGDMILSRDEQEAMARRIPDARLIVYEGVGHTFYWEDPARVAAELAGFVAGLAASGR